MGYIPSWLQSRPTTSIDGGISTEERSAPPPFATDDASQNPLDSAVAEAAMTPPTPVAINELQQKSAFDYGPALAIPLTGASFALVAGGIKSAKRTALVFMAENTHRRPTTVQGWYFYNKTKNYKVMLGAIKGGFGAAGRAGLFTLAFVAIEEAAELARSRYIERHSTDGNDIRQAAWNGRWIDSGIAGVSVAAAASVAYRLPRPTARSALALGFFTGIGVGALREVRGYLGERRLEQQAEEAQTSAA